MKSTPYTYHRSLAEHATNRAEDGNCLARWLRAADMWEKAMKYSGLSKFSVEICQTLFQNRFVKWLSRHPHIKKNYQERQCGKL